jgi:glycosyltransferase involved in cell wall biosynthesis
MKILILIQCTNLGGMEQATLLLARELKMQGHDIEFLSLNPVGELGDLLKEEDIPVSGMEYRGRLGWRSFLPLRRKLKSRSADALIMVGHNLMGMLAVGHLWKEHRVLALHFHHQGVMPRSMWKILYAVASVKFKWLAFPSEFIRTEALGIAPWIAEQTLILRNPITPRLIPERQDRLAARARLGLSGDEMLVGNAGWLIPRKRWDVLLDVAAIVCRKIPNAHFVIAGDGELKVTLQEKARELGIEEKVSWIGWQKRISDFYHSLDVMLFNSDWDAMGRTPLEAMSYGIPVVASVEHGGLREVIDSTQCGFLFESHDVEAMAAKILELWSDKKYAAVIGAAGKNRIEELGNSAAYAQGIMSALEGK